MLKLLKQLFCIHEYNILNIIYDSYILDDSVNQIYVVNLYTFRRCKKCNKFKIGKINSFTCFNKNETDTIIKMLKNHGAIYYMEFLSNCIEEEC